MIYNIVPYHGSLFHCDPIVCMVLCTYVTGNYSELTKVTLYIHCGIFSVRGVSFVILSFPSHIRTSECFFSKKF